MTSSERPNTPDVDNPNTLTQNLDTLFDLMSNEQRRYLFYFFHGQSQDTATVDELVAHLYTQFDACPAEDADRFRTQLVHGHLPKLESHGVLEYDERSQTVRYHSGSEIDRLVACTKVAEISV